MTQTGPPDNLRGKVVRGGAWLGAHYGLRLTLNFTRTIVVARIVTPADIGLIGMAALAITLVRVFTETGLQQAVIQRRDESDDILDTTWSLLLIRNIFIALILVAGAGLVARFFDEPAAESVVRVIAISLVLDGLINVSVVLFQKHLDFRRQALYQGGVEIIEFVVTITLAVVLQNVWALVYGAIAGAAGRAVLSYVAAPRRPRFFISGPIVKGLVGYGKWLTASSILVYALLNGDKLVVGRFMGTAALGIYRIAFTVSNLPATAISQVLAGVMFPAYASLQSNRPRLGRLYIKALRVTTLLSVPITVLIASLADLYVPLLLKPKWLPAVPLIQILAIFGLMRSLGATTGAVFLAIGRPDIRTRFQIVQLLIFLAAIYPMTRAWGVAGVAGAMTTHAIAINIYAIGMVIRQCALSKHQALDAVVAPLVSGGVSYLVILGLRAWSAESIPWLIALGAAGAVAYTALIGLYDLFTGHTWRRDLTEVIAGARRQPAAANIAEGAHAGAAPTDGES